MNMKQPHRRHAVLLVLADIFAFFLVFVVAVSMTWLFRSARIGGTFLSWWHTAIQKQLLVYVVLALGAMMMMGWRGHYTQRIPFWDELLQLVKLLGLFGLFNAMVVLLVKLPISRFLWPALWGLSIILLPFMRRQVRAFLRRRGQWAVATVILGAREQALEAYRALQSEPLLGFDVQAFITPESTEDIHIEVGQQRLPIYSAAGVDLCAVINTLQPVNIIIALSAGELSQIEGQVEQLGLCYQHIYIIPTLAGLPLFGVETLHFFSHEVLFLRIRNNLAARSMQGLKRVFDIIAASILLVLLSPLFLWIAYRIGRHGGKVFFGHERIGRQGKPFSCYKFRSMVPNAEAVLAHLLATDTQARTEWEKDFKLKEDPRITPIGAFLRKTSLDELPQLWNVLKGEMSLVGPRPIIEAELSRYEDKVDFYLCTRPGVTGLWQVSGRNDIDYSERVALDAWYVKNWNLWYDIVILFKTIGTVLKRKGAY
jgi:Undecaprenyl-phosphate galactose phosphotransferase WbaP